MTAAAHVIEPAANEPSDSEHCQPCVKSFGQRRPHRLLLPAELCNSADVVKHYPAGVSGITFQDSTASISRKLQAASIFRRVSLDWGSAYPSKVTSTVGGVMRLPRAANRHADVAAAASVVGHVRHDVHAHTGDVNWPPEKPESHEALASLPLRPPAGPATSVSTANRGTGTAAMRTSSVLMAHAGVPTAREPIGATRQAAGWGVSRFSGLSACRVPTYVS